MIDTRRGEMKERQAAENKWHLALELALFVVCERAKTRLKARTERFASERRRLRLTRDSAAFWFAPVGERTREREWQTGPGVGWQVGAAAG